MNSQQASPAVAPRRIRALPALLLGALLVAACGSESRGRPASQTAAKVNGDEVTVHQINAELQRVSGGNAPQAANAEAAARRLLEALIDQTLLLQQAREAKLDRDPQVLQMLESSRRQILAQAYVDRQAAAAPPTPEEIKDFYAKNPDLFSKRRVYAFREFLFEGAKLNDAIDARLNAAKSPADIAKVLDAAGIPYRESDSTRPAETLPFEALPRIAKLVKGDTLTFTDQNLVNALHLLDYTEQSVPLDRATPLIQQFLVNSKRREIAQGKVKELRSRSKIEYVGNFAKAEGAPQAAENAPAAAAPANARKDDPIEKGISGLRR